MSGKVDSVALAQLRHLYDQMLRGYVKDTAEAARGLLGPAIERLECMAAIDYTSLDALASAYALIAKLYREAAAREATDREDKSDPHPKYKQEDPDAFRQVFVAARRFMDACNPVTVQLTGGGTVVEIRVDPAHWAALTALVPLPE
jgi:hypothetical protein